MAFKQGKSRLLLYILVNFPSSHRHWVLTGLTWSACRNYYVMFLLTCWPTGIASESQLTRGPPVRGAGSESKSRLIKSRQLAVI